MENKSLSKSIIIGLSLFIGLASLGFFIFKGLKTISDKDRVINVKGLAEINMMATSSFIAINFSISGDNLQEIIQQTDAKKNAIIAHLTNSGFSKNEIKINNIDINDLQKYYENDWQNGQLVKRKIDRYTTTQTMTIQSNDVKTTQDKADKIKLELISKDLTSAVTTNYSFPELNSIKPKLIAESTKNARIAGEQFANDSQAKLGKIKTASQGQITIAGKYYSDEDAAGDNGTPSEPYIQKARVVSTIVFFLE